MILSIGLTESASPRTLLLEAGWRQAVLRRNKWTGCWRDKYACLLATTVFVMHGCGGEVALVSAAESHVGMLEQTYTPTSSSEVVSNNPIQLRIAKENISGDLQELTGAVTLEQAVQMGIRNNWKLKDVEQSWNGSQRLARAAAGRFGPAFSFNTLYSTSSLNQMLFFPADTDVSAAPMQPIVRGTSLSLIFAGSQPLFTGGRLLGSYKSARAIEHQTLAAFSQQRIVTALQVKETYWSAAWNEAKLRVVSDYVKARDWSKNNIKARFDNGKAPKADYLREEAELARARIQLNESYRDYNTGLLNLKAVMAVNLGSQMTLADSLEYQAVKGDLNSYLLQAARNRPEITTASSRVSEMKARTMVAKSRYLPQLNAYGLASNISGSSPDGNADGRWGAFIGVLGGVSLFDSGVRRNELRAANSAVRAAEFARKDVELKVAQDVCQSWIELGVAARNVELAQAEVVSAQEDQRLFHARYQVGKSIALEDLDAAVRLFQARLNVLEAIYQYRLAQARMVFACGGV